MFADDRLIEKMDEVRLKMIVEVEYTANPKHYTDGDSISAEEMAQIDANNLNENFDCALDLISMNENPSIRVEVIK